MHVEVIIHISLRNKHIYFVNYFLNYVIIKLKQKKSAPLKKTPRENENDSC
jgi:hypothetical protein